MPGRACRLDCPRNSRQKGTFSYCVDFSPDGKTLVSGGSDGLVKLWDAASGKQILTFSGHHGGRQSRLLSKREANFHLQ